MTGTSSQSLFEPAIIRRAAWESVVKLDPRTLARNPVMLVVEIGSVFTTVVFFRDLGSSTTKENVFAGLVAAFLWFTVLFANFAEAVAEGRGRPRPPRCVAPVRRRWHAVGVPTVRSRTCRAARSTSTTSCWCPPGR